MEYFKTITRGQIKQMMDEGRDFALIDLLPAEYYEEVHLPGSRNACVYEIDFIAQVEAIEPDRNKPVVIYCNSSTAKTLEVAQQKLAHAGYTNVCIYKGGAIDWRRAGNPVEGTNLNNDIFPARIENRTYTIDAGQSVVEWIGRNITGAHYGTVNLLDGTLPIQRGLPVKATFTIGMDSIQDLDIHDPALNRILVDHLKSDDFFDVANHPVARFESTSFKPLSGTKAGAQNYQVHGKFTLKNVTRDLAFPAVITLNEDGSIVAEAHFDLDRTLWNVNYGSGKLFEKLGRHLVYDIITIQLKLVAR